eukprot:7761552-Ditylum_brightwellii.AAC.1
MGGAAATATVSSFAKTLLVLLGQAPDATPLVTRNSAAGKWDSWMQVALLMGCAILPYLQELVEIVSHEAAYPYGVESFDSVIHSVWKCAMEQHGKGLAAFLKAIGI